MKEKGGAADETAAAFTISSSTPKRVTGSFRVRVEDTEPVNDNGTLYGIN